ncbi:ABC transporter ATP-binding protein [Haematomicrobium sanguinis]|uniref:ABC transporter ATP-binding protein n=1 Tax=Haematomicrobium sanguinis TaxID=479106 RepID=UPI000949ACD5|nr:ABC transporter ATP-binding protein [Haematomicrobium sanguinis]
MSRSASSRQGEQPSDAPQKSLTTETTLWHTLGRLLDYVRPMIGRLIVGLFIALSASVVALLIPQVLQSMINNTLHEDGQTKDVWISVGIIAALGILEATLVWLRRVMVITPAMSVETQMRVGLFRHLGTLPVSFHDRWAGGQLLQRSMGDLSLVRRWLAFGAIFLVTSILTVIIGTILMFTINWILAIFFLLAAIPVTITAFRFRTVFGAASRQSQEQAGDLATSVEESVHGIRVLKAFGRGGFALDSFSDQARELQVTELFKAKTLGRFLVVVISLPETALGVSLITGIILIARGELSVGALVAFFATAVVMAGPVENIGMLLGMTLTAKTALDRHFEVIDERDPLTEPENPADASNPRGELAFRNVQFRYPDAKRNLPPVLRDIDFTVRPGETMALVGVTGSGKSTLLNLVPRLYEVSEGGVEIDGVDIRDYSIEDLRTLVSVAFEDSILFSTTVRENALMGLPDGAAEDPAFDADLTQALDVAQADFAYRLPEGLDTKIGEEGLSLSGGQRQRLALARAIAAKPRILVLDDPLSALDVRTEERVTEKLREILADTTTLIVAHRPSTVMLADRVALLQDGKITAVGTHSELLANNAHYRFVIASLERETTVDDVLDEDIRDEEEVGEMA